MPRRPRVHLPGYPLHIVQRGHNREPCFFAEEDYHCYLHWLARGLELHCCALHAYVLMTNHVHLLLTPSDPAVVPTLIIGLGRRYVQYINKTYRRTGTLWDSRYKSSLVDAEDYLLKCQRYIELNPVRAGMVKDPTLYRWSSYRANALGQQDERITPHTLYLRLGDSDETRLPAYRNLFRTESDEEAISDIRIAISQNQPLGGDRFHRQIEKAMGARRQPRPRGRPSKSRNGDGGFDGEQGDLEF